jgi:hypothetical protein
MRVPNVRFSVAAACCIFAGVAMGQGNTKAVVNGDMPMRPSAENHPGTVVVRNDVVSVASGPVIASGPDNTEMRQVGRFSGIELGTEAEADFSIGPNPSIAISAPANVLPLVHTQVRDGVLTVWLENRVMISKPLKLVITGPSLQAISIPGSATMTASGLSGDSLDVSVSGSGVIVASGTVKNVRVAIVGVADVDVSAIHAKTLTANVSGSGDLHGYASDSATLDISGSGEVQVDGNPAHRSVSRSGSGDVHFE